MQRCSSCDTYPGEEPMMRCASANAASNARAWPGFTSRTADSRIISLRASRTLYAAGLERADQALEELAADGVFLARQDLDAPSQPDTPQLPALDAPDLDV